MRALLLVVGLAALAAMTYFYQTSGGQLGPLELSLEIGVAAAAILSLAVAAFAQMKGRRTLLTPAALAGFVLSLTCLLLARRVSTSFFVLWMANLGLAFVNVLRAVLIDRQAKGRRSTPSGDP